MVSQLDYDAKCLAYHEAKARAKKAENALADLVVVADEVASKPIDIYGMSVEPIALRPLRDEVERARKVMKEE